MAVAKVVAIEANVLWQAVKSASSDRWIGVCEELNLSTEADSLDELHSLIPETMHLLFADLVEENEFADYLTERGWKAGDLPDMTRGDLEFDVPWKMIAEGQSNGAERRSH
ncbi:MAG: hypothetical protein DI565_14055 [Ancylobacter novellus]|uniref:Uncharacterized protein n=1 Tax=Ancylobacter novellus TaxID=921 RepID=A0A2W5MJN4_ANCNO|nr:MAG: hypothetical protein DI565_14055 [Ancylobacter novellus]